MVGVVPTAFPNTGLENGREALPRRSDASCQEIRTKRTATTGTRPTAASRLPLEAARRPTPGGLGGLCLGARDEGRRERGLGARQGRVPQLRHRYSSGRQWASTRGTRGRLGSHLRVDAMPRAGLFPTTGSGYRGLRSDLEHRFGVLPSAEGRAAHPLTPEAERMSNRVPGRSIQDVQRCTGSGSERVKTSRSRRSSSSGPGQDAVGG